MYQKERLLLVAYYAPPAQVGAGVAMYHLLSNVPPGTYSILTEERSGDENDDQTGALDAPYYFYSSKKINPAVSHEQDSVSIGVSGYASLIHKFLNICKRLPGIHRIGQFFVIARHIRVILQAGDKAVVSEKPTMIIGYSDAGPVLIAAYLLSLKHKIPLSLHFYDLYKGNNLTPVLNFYAFIFEPLMLRRAKHIFVMNDLLRSVYQQRSGEDKVTIIYNSLPENKHRDEPVRVNRRPSIAYLGSIYWAQESALKDLIEAASTLDSRPTITLYTPYSDDYLNSIGIFESEHMVFATCHPKDAVKELEGHDLIFLGLSHSSPHQLLINTSSPVRLCDYLHARVPMLIHAPAESFVIKHAIAHNFAFVSTEPQSERLAVVLQEALTSRDRETKVKNANFVAKTFHDPRKSAEIFSSTIFERSSL